MFDLVTVDAVDSVALAAFWATSCGLTEVEREDDGRWIVLAEPATGLRRLGIQRIGGLLPAQAAWAGDRKARIHLDLRCGVGEIDAEVARLVSLGASVVRSSRDETYGRIVTLADPEGNLFDLCAYG